MNDDVTKQILDEINDIVLRVIFGQDIDCNFDVSIDDTRYIDKNIIVNKPVEHIDIKIIV